MTAPFVYVFLAPAFLMLELYCTLFQMHVFLVCSTLSTDFLGLFHTSVHPYGCGKSFVFLSARRLEAGPEGEISGLRRGGLPYKRTKSSKALYCAQMCSDVLRRLERL